MSGRVVRYRTARDFLKRNEPWLLEAEDRNNLVLSLAYGLAEGQGDERLAYLAGVEAEGRTVGCALRAPPHQVVLTEMPEAAAITVARHVAETDAAIPAVLGPPALAESFAREWVSLRGGAWLPGTDQRLYRLDAVTPLHAPGSFRMGRREDAPLAARWVAAFGREVHMHFGPSQESVASWIDRGHLFFWEHGGAAVSMAVAHGCTPSGGRIGYVYTPAERRRRGYAGACVSELSRHLIASGLAFCVLFADLSNPTSNALYERMGYRPVADVRDCHIRAEEP
ncbi:MAG TPA: GNAT family N-acetyltransferase, partial [Longimicrobiales bacterium]|nr:GNAT family N-acetyltransferase [Longimicrobiales bacterium]